MPRYQYSIISISGQIETTRRWAESGTMGKASILPLCCFTVSRLPGGAKRREHKRSQKALTFIPPVCPCFLASRIVVAQRSPVAATGLLYSISISSDPDQNYD